MEATLAGDDPVLSASPFRAKVVGDFHWLELELTHQLALDWDTAPAAERQVSTDTLAALYFARTVVCAYQSLTPTGRNTLEGRIRDALKSDTGFSSLYLEMDIARRLLDAGYEVEYTDMDGLAQYDLRFRKGNVEGEVECKSLSTDAGRKIHRRDFYRFVDSLEAQIVERLAGNAREIIVVTLDGRLPSDDARQHMLRSAASRLLSDESINDIRGSCLGSP